MAIVTGTIGNDNLTGTIGNDIIDGLAGADTMAGGKGSDTYHRDNAGDMIVESAGAGTDTVISSVSYTLAANIENLTLAGGAGSLLGRGNELKNILVGNEGHNLLDGQDGADTMKGGVGFDSYVVDHVGDRIVENAGEGTDSVFSLIDFSLANLSNVENLHLTGSGTKATGNAQTNYIYGNDQANVIDGGKGADHMEGADGNDTYYVDNIGDVVVEVLGEGLSDLVISTVALSNALGAVENYDFSKVKTGLDFTGNSLHNVIKAGAGIDVLAGGGGNDHYYLNSAKDAAVEAAGEGEDMIFANFSLDLGNYANIEHGQLTGTAALNLTGNAADNLLFGNDGANVLKGGGGSDGFAGGKGNDTYYVDDGTDGVSENAKEGVDTIVSQVGWTLQDNVEKLVLAAGAGDIHGFGNDLNNTITGNEGDNNLNGLAGADTLTGGKGNDIYVVHQAGDRVIERANEGTDGVISHIDYSLAALAHVESLVLSGTAVKATGNARDNFLQGNAEGNIIDGGKGADTLVGGTGNDTYYVDNLGDVVEENGGAGVDTIVSTIALAGAVANVENYDFSKLRSGIAFSTGSADNVIKGGAGIDTLSGGLGNDTYFLNSAKDVVVEATLGGSDDAIAVTFSADLADYDFIEHVTLLGSAALKAAGTSSGNRLTGNAGANVLDGRAGADTLVGGKGGDTYHVDNAGDTIVENAKEGVDTVVSTVTHILAANVDNLTLAAGAGNIEGHGNALGNVITGNESGNVLVGKGGNDTMKGGKGDDTYIVENAGDKIVELAAEGKDRVFASVDFSLAAFAQVEELYLEGAAKNGTGNALANVLVGSAQDNVLDGGTGADTMIGGLGGDTYRVDHLGDLVEELGGGGFDTVVSTVALSQAFANVEAYDFTKAKSAVDFEGTSAGNYIYSSAFADTLTGGDGGDSYWLNNAGDKIVELDNQGKDTAYVSFSVTQLWDNVENLYYRDGNSTVAWNAVGNDADNVIQGNRGNNALTGGLGADLLIGMAGNDTLTGGGGADTFLFAGVSLGSPLSGRDVIADFDGNLDILVFSASDSDGNGTVDQADFVADVVDNGAGKSVVVHLLNGGSITFLGAGTGSVDSLDDLVVNPAAQIEIP